MINRTELYQALQNIFANLDDDEQDEKMKRAIATWLNAEQHRQALKY